MNCFDTLVSNVASLPTDSTHILPVPVADAIACDSIDVPSCGPQFDDKLMFITAGLPTLSA